MLAEISRRCLARDGQQRPTFQEVLRRLSAAAQSPGRVQAESITAV
jgi:hypothetical protein